MLGIHFVGRGNASLGELVLLGRLLKTNDLFSKSFVGQQGMSANGVLGGTPSFLTEFPGTPLKTLFNGLI